MKFTCQKEDLLRVFQAAEPITGSKVTFTILHCLLFETIDEATVSVKASNMETSLQAILPAKVAAKGSVALFLPKLAEVVKGFESGEILFEVEKNHHTTVRTLDKKRSARATLSGQSKADFPALPEFPAKAPQVTIDKLAFRKMIQKTLFAVSSDSTKYTLNGVLLEVGNNLLKMVAIDGRRLALIQSALPDADAPELSLIIPQPVLAQLLKIIHNEGPIVLASGENRIHFRLDQFTISSNVLAGKFPNYGMFIPAQHEHRFTANRDEVRRAVSFAAALADSQNQKMIWDLKDETLVVQASDTEHGNSSEDVFVHYKGPEHKIGLNYKLLGEILREIDTEEVEFAFNNALSPVLVREKDRKEFFYILMPMRLDAA